MKEKLFKISKQLLCCAMGISWIFASDYASTFLFGEYPYPQQEN